MSSYDYGGFSYNPNNNAYGYNQESFQDGTNSAAYNNNNTDAGYGYDFANYAHQNAYGQGYDSKAQAASNHDYLNTGFLSTPAAQIGMQVGSQALSAGQSYVNSNLQRWVSMALLREYFYVTNSYVMNKLLLIFFPFIRKDWQRNFRFDQSTGQIAGYQYPRDDVCAPDLYIPVMSLVSYIILVGLIMGIKKAYQVELLGITATSCIMSVGIEIFLIKLGCYILNIGEGVHTFDFLAFSGYKFCPLIASSLAGMWGRLPKHSVFGYCSLAYGLFLMRSLRSLFLPENSDALIVSQRRRRINFLLAIVALEIISSYFLLK